jgi:hypothetical protein
VVAVTSRAVEPSTRLVEPSTRLVELVETPVALPRTKDI